MPPCPSLHSTDSPGANAKLAVVICATQNYTYAMEAQAYRVCANLSHLDPANVIIILVGDRSRELRRIYDLYFGLLPQSIVKLVSIDIETDDHESYKTDAQLLIARMRSRAHAEARSYKAYQCWSLDSDVLPPSNALRCMQTMLEFDDGYYGVSTCPYPNTGFLGGFGSPQNHIAEDYLPKERKLPDALRADVQAEEEERKALKDNPTDEQVSRWTKTRERVKECPPDGNIWEVTAKHGWRRRGWLDNAYPGIGKGAVVPSDWCGFGCTLMGREALALATFDGYDGKGTEDLFICWERWYPAGIRINVIPHCPCDHVIWDKKKKGGDPTKFTHLVVGHELEGEYRGHLRIRNRAWLTTGSLA